MTSFRNVMMFKRPDFGATIGNAGAAAKRQASPDEEFSEETAYRIRGRDRGET